MRTQIAAICLAAALFAGGPARAEQKPKATTEPLRLGLLLDMSGPYSDMTGVGSETAAKMAAEDFGGKVLGRPIEILVADVLNKPDVASAQARNRRLPGDRAP